MKKYKVYKDTRLLEMLDSLDEAYIAEVVDNLKLQSEPAAPLPRKVVVLRSIRTAAALVACALLLGALIPVISYVTANFPDFVAYLRGESTTEAESTEKVPDEHTETTAPPETTEEVKHEHNGSEGLIYKVNDDGNSVTLVSYGTFEGKDPIVASLYDGLPVIAIADGAFEGSNYKTITIPEGIISIGVGAFKNCASLVTVSMPGSITDIGANAFEGCVSIRSIGIPSGLTVIPSGLFTNCENLTHVRIQPNIKRIVMGAFIGCEKLQDIEFVGQKTEWQSINKGEFWHMQSGIKYVHCNNGSITVQPAPSGTPTHDGSEGLEYSLSGAAATLESLGSCTDKDVVIASTYMGYPVKWIAAGVFDGYSRMESVIIPETVASIGSRAFADCSKLESISLGASVHIIYSNAFIGCSSLKKIEIDPDNTAFVSKGNCIIDMAKNTLLVACNNSVIPDDGSVTVIGEYAFTSLSSITEIVVPEGIQTLKAYAFSNCASLRKLSLPSTLKSIHRNFLAGYKSVPTILFPNGNDTYSAEGNCLIDKATKTVLGGYAGSVIPDWVTSIGEEAFKGCAELVSINFPKSLSVINPYAFMDCTSLEKITIEGSTIVYGSAFNGCTSLREVELGDGVRFSGGGIFNNCSSLESIRIPQSVTSLMGQFYGCSKLSEIILHDNINDLSKSAFSGCSALQSIYISENVHYLPELLFNGCVSLTQIVYGGTRHEWYTIEKDSTWKTGTVELAGVLCSDGVVNLNVSQPMAGSYGLLYRESADGKSAEFIGFKEGVLNTFEIATTYNGLPVTGIAEGALSRLTTSGTITLGNNIEKIEAQTFAQSPYISHIELLPNLKSIEDDAFLGCIALKELTFRGKIEAWNKLEKGARWNYGTAIEVVHCLDGDVSVTPHLPANNGSEGLTYRITMGTDGDFYAVFTGLGTCTDTDIVIASEYYSYPVLALQQGTLRGKTEIKSVKLPDLITEIPNSFFNGCSSLKKVELPDALVTIGQHVFRDCTSLEKIELPETLEVIGNYAFGGCSSLKKINIPESVTSLGVNIFEGTLIDSIHITKNIIDIGTAVFGSNVKKITVDPDHPIFVITGNCLIDRERRILLRVFGEPEFPQDGSIRYIGESAFDGIDFEIKKLILPEGLEDIGWYSSESLTSIEELHIPSTFVDWNGSTFRDLINLKKITVAEGNPKFYSVDNCIIDRETGKLVLGCNTSVIPTDGSITSIGVYAFRGCGEIKSIVIPEGVVELGHGAFYGCTSLREIVYGGTVEEWNSITIYPDAFLGTALEKITCTDGVITEIPYETELPVFE